MSRQARANALVQKLKCAGYSRKEIISQLVNLEDISESYASTLYATANRQNGGSTIMTREEFEVHQEALAATKKTSDTIQSFNKSNLRALRVELDAALRQISEKHNIAFKLGSIRFGMAMASARLQIVAAGASGDAEQNAFDSQCGRVGLMPSDFGTPFDYKGEKWTVCGVRPRARKYNILARNAAGKTLCFTKSILGQAIGLYGHTGSASK